MIGPVEFVRRVRDLLRAGDAERRLDEEVRFHLQMEAEMNEREGMTPHEARRVAATRFGGVDTHKESVRDARGFRWIDDLISDTRYAWRSLRRAAGFTSIAVVTLSMGIGVTTAVFTVFNAVLLRPLPYPDADRLAVV